MKKRIIACVLTCATLLMGTGFAYWTDLISVNATAETGHCDIKECKSNGKNCALPGHFKFLGTWYHLDNTKSVTKDVSIDLPEGATFKIDGTTFVRLSALKDVTVSDQLSSLLYLTKDSKMSFAVTIGMDPDAAGIYTTGSAALNNPNNNTDANTQDTIATVNMGLVWDQYNER